jgi:hypothetical protein
MADLHVFGSKYQKFSAQSPLAAISKEGWILDNCTGARGLYPETITAPPSDSSNFSLMVLQASAIAEDLEHWRKAMAA